MEENKKETVVKAIKHRVNFSTGEHRQWVIEPDGKEREIFEGDEEWEE